MVIIEHNPVSYILMLLKTRLCVCVCVCVCIVGQFYFKFNFNFWIANAFMCFKNQKT